MHHVCTKQVGFKLCVYETSGLQAMRFISSTIILLQFFSVPKLDTLYIEAFLHGIQKKSVTLVEDTWVKYSLKVKLSEIFYRVCRYGIKSLRILS